MAHARFSMIPLVGSSKRRKKTRQTRLLERCIELVNAEWTCGYYSRQQCLSGPDQIYSYEFQKAVDSSSNRSLLARLTRRTDQKYCLVAHSALVFERTLAFTSLGDASHFRADARTSRIADQLRSLRSFLLDFHEKREKRFVVVNSIILRR